MEISMNLQADLGEKIKNKLLEMQKSGALPEGNWADYSKIEVPANRSFGDFALNAAMIIAQQCKQNPRQTATTIVNELQKMPEIESISIAGPGFINLKLTDKVWEEALRSSISEGQSYGNSNLGKNEKLNVEFLSANPTGPLHVGHTRGAIFGDVLSRLLKKNGYNVTTEYYINDYGHQVEVLSDSVFWRYEELFGLHNGEKMAEGKYPGDYIISVAEYIKSVDGDKWLKADEEERREYFKDVAIVKMMELIRSNLKDLGIFFDVYTSEKSLVKDGSLEKILALMDKKGLLYKGMLAKPQHEVEDNNSVEIDEEWEDKQQLLFKASEFGDDGDRVIARSDGSTTYFASDIAYHYNKFNRGFKKQIDVWGADHGGYVKRMKAAVSAVTDGQAELEMDLCQIVNLEKDGKPFRMSKRAGNFVLSSDILQEVNADAFRLSMLTKSANSQMTFDLSKVKEKTKDNPVFYIQYAYARCNSVMKAYTDTFNSNPEDIKLSDISVMENIPEAERNIVRTIIAYPAIIEAAGLSRAPHMIVTYLEELAKEFHSLWTIGAKAGKRFVDASNRAVSDRNMVLIRAVMNTLENGLLTIGVTPQKQMDYKED